MKADFDYENKVWGEPEVKPSPFYIQGLKLGYALEDLAKIKGRVVDVGCGAGNMPKAIKRYRPDLEVYGIDVSKTAIEVAKADPQGVKFRVGAAEKIPFRTGSVDAVLMFDLLEHLTDPGLALREVKRVLKKGRVFHILLPLDKQPWTLYWVLYKIGWQPKDKHTGHVMVYSDREFVELAESNDLEIVKKRFSFHWLFSLFDIAYFSILEILNIKASASIEGMVEKKRENPLVFVFNIFYRLVIALGYVESRLLYWFPGGAGHFLVVPKQGG